MNGFKDPVIAQQIIERQEQIIQELQEKLAEVFRYRGTPAPCPHCGSLDYPVCPRCHEERE